MFRCILNTFRSQNFPKFGGIFQPARLFHPARLFDTLEYSCVPIKRAGPIKQAGRNILSNFKNEQALLSEQVLNSTVLPARFLFSAYVVANKQAG